MMCKELEVIAIEKIYDFLNEFCPYEVDDVIGDWKEAIYENPMAVMECIEEYGNDIDYNIQPVYDAMYDAVYEVCLCSE